MNISPLLPIATLHWAIYTKYKDKSISYFVATKTRIESPSDEMLLLGLKMALTKDFSYN